MSDFYKLKTKKNGKEYVLNACTQDTEQNITGTKNFSKLTVNSKNVVTSINGLPASEDGNVLLGTEKSTFNKVVFDTGYFSIGTDKNYSFDLAGSDLENVSKENVSIHLVAKVVTAHRGFEVGDTAQLTPTIDYDDRIGDLDVCSYIRGNTLYVYSGKVDALSIATSTVGHLLKANVQIKAVLTAFVPDDGSILLIAEDQTNTSKLIGLPDGTLTWGGKTIAPVTGKIEWFAFNTPPDGYLVCNGANVSRETYTDLFAVIGTTFGEGDGSTTFTLPDLRDRYVIGANTNALGTYIAEQLPNITGNVGGVRPTSIAPSGAFSHGSGIVRFTSDTTARQWLDMASFNASLSNSIYTDGGKVYPLSLALLPCIKY